MRQLWSILDPSFLEYSWTLRIFEMKGGFGWENSAEIKGERVRSFEKLDVWCMDLYQKKIIGHALGYDWNLAWYGDGDGVWRGDGVRGGGKVVVGCDGVGKVWWRWGDDGLCLINILHTTSIFILLDTLF